jgi:hypothetical protein
MNAMTGLMTEALRLGGVDFSSWDMSVLLGDPKLWGITALFVGFFQLCAWYDARLSRQDHEPSVDRK